MNRNLKVAAAVAAVLASSASMAQLAPTPASAAAPVVGLYISGSSAAKNAVLGAIEGADVCGGTYSTVQQHRRHEFLRGLLRSAREHGPAQREWLEHLHDLVP